ncbi:MAG: hypothetical protein U1G07_21285 [Verrucomicrobiota bacterium]
MNQRLGRMAGMAALLTGLWNASGAAAALSQSNREHVGRQGFNRTVTPAHQVVTPLGLQVELPGVRPQALALSPDGAVLVTSGKTSELIAVDPATGAVLQRVPFPNEAINEPQPQAPSANILSRTRPVN